jgi:uncharacterized membrane protein YphA (DoxX/SURF4 family)
LVYYCKMMSEKLQNRIGWVLSILLSLVFVMSATMKITGNEEALKQAMAMGFENSSYQVLGYLELLAVVLFLIPRTGVVGVLLLMVYMGGAICAHLLTKQPLLPVVLFEVMLWVAAAFRFPEIRNRLLNA